MSREIDLNQVFEDLDSNIRELLSTVHSIRISKIVHDEEKARENLVKARWLAQKITEALYELG